jgi:hypothetical protein
MVLVLNLRRNPRAFTPQILMTAVSVGGCQMIGYWGPSEERFVSMFQAMLLALATGTALLSMFPDRTPTRAAGLEADAANDL